MPNNYEIKQSGKQDWTVYRDGEPVHSGGSHEAAARWWARNVNVWNLEDWRGPTDQQP